MILDLRALDDRDVKAHVRSKMLGQEWQFQARLEATIRPGQVVELEAPADEVLPGDGTPEASSPGPAGGGKDDGAVLAMKRELGRMGLEATPEGFDQAVRGGKVEAVRLFLKLDMNPNARDFRGEHLLMIAVTFCATAQGDKEVVEKRGDVVLALLEAGADVHGGTEPRSAMTLIWATRSCPPRVVQAMIEKGADVNARAPGGATPLLTTRFRQDAAGPEIAAMLRKAGAKE
jgi:hypothetical protein